MIELRDRTSVKWEAALVCDASERLAVLNDVVENKEYIFRVRAENKAGIGRPSVATKPVKIMDPIGVFYQQFEGLFDVHSCRKTSEHLVLCCGHREAECTPEFELQRPNKDSGHVDLGDAHEQWRQHDHRLHH